MSTNVLVGQGVTFGGPTSNNSRILSSKGKCSRLLLTVVYFESFQNCLTFCKMIKTNVLFAQKKSLQDVQLQTHIESYQVKGNVLTY